MDNLDRMYRHLVRTIRAKFPQYLSQPFDVAELYQNILPYRHHRRELGLETNEDYEITLTELLSGARDYVIVDDRMRDALRDQLASVNPDPSAFKQFASASVALSPNALRSLASGPDDPSTPLRSVAVPEVRSLGIGGRTAEFETVPAPGTTAERERPVASTSGAARPTGALPSESKATQQPAAQQPAAQQPAAPTSLPAPTTAPSGARAITPEPGATCRWCNEDLPVGRAITFCPHCGQNLTTMNCPACGSELEVGWKFCAVCGRPTSGR
jgi:hypothetical protein